MSLLNPTTRKALDVPRAGTQGSAPAKPARLSSSFSLGWLLFIAVVLVPTVCAFVYYGAIASDRYVSESRFLVRSASTQDVSGLSSFLQTFGISRADDDSYAVQSYIESRDALRDLMKTLPMETYLNREWVDPISVCYKPWSERTFETLYECYLSYVSIVREQDTGISWLRVDLFTPEDSQNVAQELLRLSEQLANRMNQRAEEDALSNANNLMAQAEERVLEAQSNLTQFRNQQMFLDIEGEASPTASVIGELTGELARTRAAIDQQTRVSPSNPTIASLKTKASVLEDQLSEEQQKLTGTDDALSNQISTFEELTLRKVLADQALTLASKAIDQARLEARRQSIYIETVVRPNLPDDSTEPRRFRTIITVLLVSMMLFAVTWMILIGGREHLNSSQS
ncbi:hypothetical protein [Jiella marina]|uniref:hypothetical protein n=1 Tax=Jiella sp. LLJ827 TaxID=2917712 RepID=UPI0021019767|nr:hypothetical protein [Jiella sp. LLJ827]MCQ0990283.1 hypothetical protein [Jiella sp. LLJ827]